MGFLRFFYYQLVYWVCGTLAIGTITQANVAFSVKEFTSLCLTWAALVDSGPAAASLWIPPEV